MKNLKWLGCALLTIILVTACNGGKQKKEIRIAYANWVEGIAMSNLACVLFEDQGYEVDMMNADVAPIFASLSRKKTDVFMDIWLPFTHADYLKKYGSDLELIGVNYDNALIGLVVPDYVDINSIEEMNAVKERFDKNIVGIDAGAGIMKASEKALKAYDLDFKLQTASGPAMTATLKKAIDKKEWVVVTGWTPHWMFDRYDLKFLKDPKKCYGNAEEIKTYAWKGFAEKDPFAAELLSNISFNDEQISSLISALMKNPNKEREAIREWIKDNQKLVDSWMPKKVK